MKVFEQSRLGSIVLPNRIIRSATYEGMCDAKGFPTGSYTSMYCELAKNGIGAIITGFAYINKEGRAMHPGQAGIDTIEKIPAYREITDHVHAYGSKIILQIAHTGRQTRKSANGGTVYGVSAKKSFYFNEKPVILTTEKTGSIVEQFAGAALNAKQAGFDGIQLHAAHGYLIHQFLLASINSRSDAYAINPQTGLGTKFLDEVIDRIREKCGTDYPLLIKISGSDDYFHSFSKKQFIRLIQYLDTKKLAGIETSYGTMDYALNIIRGYTIPFDSVLKYNPRYKQNSRIMRALWKFTVGALFKLKTRKMTPMYNLEFAIIAKRYTDTPIITVGGFRAAEEIHDAVENKSIDFVSLCRPFICEPNFALKALDNKTYVSRCTSCNICSVMCDSPFPTQCYTRKNERGAYGA